MSKSGLWVIAAVAVITLLSLVYMALTYEAPQGTTTVVLPSPTQQQEPDPQPREAEPASNSLPSIRIEPERPAPAGRLRPSGRWRPPPYPPCAIAAHSRLISPVVCLASSLIWDCCEFSCRRNSDIMAIISF